MAGRRRTRLAIEAERRNAEQLGRMGAEVRDGRRQKRLTQEQLGGRVGLGRMAISRAERGQGGGLTLDAWQRIGIAIDRPLIVRFQHDVTGETVDAGHLALQELVLRLARPIGYRPGVELATRAAEPWRSVDVLLADDGRRTLILVECWNTFGDLGAALRSTDRKRAEAEALATARWGVEPHRVGAVWVVRASTRNQALVARYPELFASRFTGSSAGWVAAITVGASPPEALGLVWADAAATRIYAWRRRSERRTAA